MKLLLDTHTFLWFINDDKRLSLKAKELISKPNNIRYLSYASIWEIAIKSSLGRIEIPIDFEKFIEEQLKINNILIFPFSISHLAKVKELPFIHKDPFDRIIISQSIIENVSILGIDSVFDKYGITRIW
ncbi:MAG: twitching motility protein PilT [Bacteroidetes bacterium GWA2_31_9]|nr:MAG: twitching motility protein PilT [Bacteroidetes bacterium GWA2_31_9]